MTVPPQDLEPEQKPRADLVRAALERILASHEFVGSAQLSRFFRHIVENSLSGGNSDLRETVIGVTVFNRGPSYDPKADPIVRVEARRLRTRLDAYYQKNGGAEAIRISLPKGGYVPSFEVVQTASETIPRPAVARRVRKFLSGWAAAVLLLCAGAVIAAGALVYRAQEPDRLAALFWSSLLQANRPALLIPADNSLVLLEDLSHQSVSLPEYISGEYRARLIGLSVGNREMVSIFGARRYTSIADLEFAVRLAHRPEARREGVVTKYARDVRVGDLKGQNIILLGARQSNPWVGLFEKDATFRLDDDENTAGLRIVNLTPQEGEPAVIAKSLAEMSKEIYAIITYHRNTDGPGMALLVAGMDVAGTEAAADFLLDDARLVPWLRKAKADGEIRDFDALLRGLNLGGAAPRAEVIAFHVKPLANRSTHER
jgi:hypothetical protein